VYGQEVNIACKLGEDLGQHGSIQCSEAFHSAVKTDPQYRFEPMNVAPSGAKPCWKLAY
jgi:hypothetical protein